MKANILNFKPLYLFLLLFQFSFFAFSQTDSVIQKVKYEDVKTLYQTIGNYEEMVIITDLDSMMLNKKTDKEQKARIIFRGKEKKVFSLKAKIQARGKFRRVKCDIPPLKINFSKKDLDKLGLHRDFDKIKLVTHCYDKESSDPIILKEYWCYKMYNAVTDYSFKVTRFKIIYKDLKDLKRTIEGVGFFIEPNEEMAFRMKGELIDSLGLLKTTVTDQSYHHFVMFNYMIGNTDWNIELQKNVKFVRVGESDKLTLVPYDFDNSKLVDAPYMSLYPDAKTVKLDNRYVKEKFNSKEALHAEMEYFISLKNENGVFVFNKCEHLKRSEKLNMKAYLKPFFKKIKSKKKMEKIFLEK